jgi:DNA-directed RNA polymerase specialized sigma24 family protein
MLSRNTDMHQSSFSTLKEFNGFVLACQDEAYTLACYMLGDMVQAEEVVQTAIGQVFEQCLQQEGDCRRHILLAVLENCRKAIKTFPEKKHLFSSLSIEERQAVIFVDVLVLNYSETMFILGWSGVHLTQMLSGGRYKMARRYNRLGGKIRA